MRQIKFRAWDKEEKEMIYNVQSKYDHVDSKGNEHDGYSDWNFSDFLEYPEKVTVMQYTGLKDKKGVEIYESDIVETNRYVGTIGKFEDVVGEVLYSSPKFKVEYMDSFYCKLHGGSEVIGNIYENKELLK